jgi:hypothetical protein
MENKQTAVEWYEKEIDSLFEKYVNEEISIRDFFTMKRNLFYKAKEMEKKQHKLTFEASGDLYTSFDLYYLETLENQ